MHASTSPQTRQLRALFLYSDSRVSNFSLQKTDSDSEGLLIQASDAMERLAAAVAARRGGGTEGGSRTKDGTKPTLPPRGPGGSRKKMETLVVSFLLKNRLLNYS